MTGNRGTAKGAGIAALLLFAAIGLAACDYGRMYDQESIKTYERKAVPIDGRAVPVEDDGLSALRSSDPAALRNPMSSSPKAVEHGRLVYGYFCAQCHGPDLDGNGTVGQSFSPLPADLRSASVLSQTDGAIYGKVRLGFKRHPALFTTVDREDAWAVVTYIRSLGER